MFCRNCGKELPNDSKYCYMCGTIFNEENQTNTQQNKDDTIQQATTKPKKNKKGLKTVAIVFGSLLFFCMLLIVIIILATPAETEESQKENIFLESSKKEVVETSSSESIIDQDIVGKWEHIGQNDSLAFEFFADGRFHYLYKSFDSDLKKVSGKFSMTDSMLILENSPDKNHKYIIEKDWLYIWVEGIKYDLLKRDNFGFSPIIDENGNQTEPDYSFDESVASNGEVVGTNFNQGGSMDIYIHEGKVEDIASFVNNTYWTQTGIEYKPEGGYIQKFYNNFPYIYNFAEGEFQISFLDGKRFEQTRQEPSIDGEWYTEEHEYIMDPIGYYVFTNPREVEIDGENVVIVEIFFAKQDKLYHLTLANDIPCSNIVEYKKRTDSTPMEAFDGYNTDVNNFLGKYSGGYENNSGNMDLIIEIDNIEKASEGDFYYISAVFDFSPTGKSSNGKSGAYDMIGELEIIEENVGYVWLEGMKWITKQPSENYNMLNLTGYIDLNENIFYGRLDRDNKPDFNLVKE